MTGRVSFRLTEGSVGVAPWLDLPRDWRRPDAAGAYRLFWRNADGYGQILPRPSASEVAEFYAVDGYYTHGGGSEIGTGRIDLGWRILRHLAWRADRGVEATPAWWADLLGPAPLRVIEIGCGDGIILDRLRRLGHVVTGVEPDPAAAAAARARALTVHEATAEDLPEALMTGETDLVILSHVLEHCLDPELALDRCRRVLRPGGRLVVEVPNNAAAGLALHGATWLWLDVPRHLNFFTDASLTAMLDAAGFRPERTEYVGFYRQVSAQWLSEQDRVAAELGLRSRSGLFDQILWLFRTWAASAPRKYDSLRMIARCDDGPAP